MPVTGLGVEPDEVKAAAAGHTFIDKDGNEYELHLIEDALTARHSQIHNIGKLVFVVLLWLGIWSVAAMVVKYVSKESNTWKAGLYVGMAVASFAVIEMFFGGL